MTTQAPETKIVEAYRVAVMVVKALWGTHAFGCKYPMSTAGLNAPIVTQKWCIKTLRDRCK